MTDDEAETLRAEVAALREEVRLLRESMPAAQVHHHYPAPLPPVITTVPDWQTVTYPGTAMPLPRIWVSQPTACPGAADMGWQTVIYNYSPACADQMTYQASIGANGCAGGVAGQTYTVVVP